MIKVITKCKGKRTTVTFANKAVPQEHYSSHCGDSRPNVNPKKRKAWSWKI